MMTNHQRTRWEYIMSALASSPQRQQGDRIRDLEPSMRFLYKRLLQRLILERQWNRITRISNRVTFSNLSKMTVQISLFILLSVVALVGAFFPRSAFQQDFHRQAAEDSEDLGSSGNGPDEPLRGSVRVVKLSPHFLRRAAGSHVSSKNSPSRGAFPAFLSHGRPGPSVLSHNNPAALLPPVSASGAADARRKQGLEMWQKVMHKSERSKEAVAQRINPKDMTKQSCAAVPFTQVAFIHSFIVYMYFIFLKHLISNWFLHMHYCISYTGAQGIFL